MRSPVRVIGWNLVVLVVVLATTTSASTRVNSTGAAFVQPVAFQVEPVVHVPPVDAPIVDPFRPPEHAFGPGNLGLEYSTTPGGLVTASAPGVVSFAGQVGGTLFVTVDHGGGLRTTVGLLAEVTVSAGSRVVAGTPLGRAGAATHFSARREGRHFDPELLFGAFEISVRLVPSAG